MYQTLGQRRNNWRRAVCKPGPDGLHQPSIEEFMTIGDTSYCDNCGVYIVYEHTHWMSPRPVTIKEWP